MATGQAPLGLWPVALSALAFVFARIAQSARPGRAAFWAGAGYFAVALNWIVEPFLVEPEVYGWMAPFGLLGMALGGGLFWGLAGALGARMRHPMLGLALAFAASDLLRSYLFTGFPWALIGHIFIGTPLAQAAALVGPVGLTLLATLTAAALASLRRGPVLAAACLLAGVALGGLWRLAAAPAPQAGAPIIRLVQPNATQAEKWKPDQALAFFERQLAQTSAAPLAGGQHPSLIVWPETAIPWDLADPGPALEMIADAAGGVPVLLGAQRSEGLRFFNSLAVIGPKGVVGQVYDKFHLVPFGEYVPLGDWLGDYGFDAFAATAGNFYSAGPGARLLDLGALGRVQPLICYEAVFPQDLRAAPERPDWLVQVTNDAWFGALSGPYQHLAQARLRAIEQGLPLLRSANTGVSAVIDPYGRILAQTALNTEGFLDAPLPQALAATAYARSGDFPALLLICAALLALFPLPRPRRELTD